jgi:hypothetical protein
VTKEEVFALTNDELDLEVCRLRHILTAVVDPVSLVVTPLPHSAWASDWHDAKQLFDAMREEHGYATLEGWAAIRGQPEVFQAHYGFGDSGGMMAGNTAAQAITRAYVLSRQEA